MVKVARKFHSISLRTRLTMTFFTLALVLIMFISLYAYMRMAQSTEAEVTHSTNQILSSLENFLDYRLDEADRIAGIIVMNPDVQTILNEGNASIPLEKQIDDYKHVSRLLALYQSNYDIYRLRLYIREGLIYSNENINILSLNNISAESWYKELASHKAQVKYGMEHAYYVWNNPEDIVFCARPIFSMNNLNEVIGIVRVDILKSDIDKILASAVIPSQQGTVLLMTSDNAFISMAGAGWYDNGSISFLSNLAKGKHWVNIGNQRTFVDVQIVANTGWRICYIVSADQMFKSIQVLRSEMLVVVVVAIILALLATIFGVSRNVKQINELIARMKQVRNGDFTVRSPVSGNNEIGQLELNFNYLVQSVGSLMDEVVKDQQNLRNSEIRLLQSQIQPHFLYNTLDLINWSVMRQGDSKTSQIIRNLSSFYKIGLSHGSEMIVVRKELEHVQLYLSIQNDRFDNAISFDINVDPKVLDYMIPKAILQPLVENSILHGFQEKSPNDEKHIWIYGGIDAVNLFFEVSDNGVGMPDELMKNILKKDQEHHFGIRSIQERIQLIYGSEYGLVYQCNLPQGVKVRILLPAIVNGKSKHA